MKTKLLLIVSLLVAGCQRQEMAKLLPPGQTRIMTDEQGRRYSVRYHEGELYVIQPYNP